MSDIYIGKCRHSVTGNDVIFHQMNSCKILKEGIQFNCVINFSLAKFLATVLCILFNCLFAMHVATVWLLHLCLLISVTIKWLCQLFYVCMLCFSVHAVVCTASFVIVLALTMHQRQ